MADFLGRGLQSSKKDQQRRQIKGGGCKPGTPQETRAREHYPPIPSFIVSLKLSGRKGALLGKVNIGVRPEWAPH